jgi:prefoldin alpha subunit
MESSQSREPGPEEVERQVQEDLMRLEAYRNQLSQILQQHQVLSASRADHLRAIDALQGLEHSGEAEVLLPLGGEAYIRGHPDRAGPVLLGIGSGVVAEMERPKAAEILAQRTKRIEEAGEELEGQIRTLEERMTLLSRRVEALSARSGPGEAGPGDDGDVVGD